jgi:hypothetical protein
MKEQNQLDVIQRVFRSELPMAEAALVLPVSERHSHTTADRYYPKGHAAQSKPPPVIAGLRRS